MVALRLLILTSALLALGCALAALRPAAAEDEPFTMVPANPDAVVVDNVAMVPVRPIADLVGADLVVTGERIAVRHNEAEFACRFGQKAALSNAVPITLPCAPYKRLGVGYVPLRPLVVALCGTLDVAKNVIRVDIPGAPRLTLPLLPGDPQWPSEGKYDSLYLVDGGNGRNPAPYLLGV